MKKNTSDTAVSPFQHNSNSPSEPPSSSSSSSEESFVLLSQTDVGNVSDGRSAPQSMIPPQLQKQVGLSTLSPTVPVPAPSRSLDKSKKKPTTVQFNKQQFRELCSSRENSLKQADRKQSIQWGRRQSSSSSAAGEGILPPPLGNDPYSYLPNKSKSTRSTSVNATVPILYDPPKTRQRSLHWNASSAESNVTIEKVNSKALRGLAQLTKLYSGELSSRETGGAITASGDCGEDCVMSDRMEATQPPVLVLTPLLNHTDGGALSVPKDTNEQDAPSPISKPTQLGNTYLANGQREHDENGLLSYFSLLHNKNDSTENVATTLEEVEITDNKTTPPHVAVPLKSSFPTTENSSVSSLCHSLEGHHDSCTPLLAHLKPNYLTQLSHLMGNNDPDEKEDNNSEDVAFREEALRQEELEGFRMPKRWIPMRLLLLVKWILIVFVSSVTVLGGANTHFIQGIMQTYDCQERYDTFVEVVNLEWLKDERITTVMQNISLHSVVIGNELQNFLVDSRFYSTWDRWADDCRQNYDTFVEDANLHWLKEERIASVIRKISLQFIVIVNELQNYQVVSRFYSTWDRWADILFHDIFQNVPLYFGTFHKDILPQEIGRQNYPDPINNTIINRGGLCMMHPPSFMTFRRVISKGEHCLLEDDIFNTDDHEEEPRSISLMTSREEASSLVDHLSVEPDILNSNDQEEDPQNITSMSSRQASTIKENILLEDDIQDEKPINKTLMSSGQASPITEAHFLEDDILNDNTHEETPQNNASVSHIFCTLKTSNFNTKEPFQRLRQKILKLMLIQILWEERILEYTRHQNETGTVEESSKKNDNSQKDVAPIGGSESVGNDSPPFWNIKPPSFVKGPRNNSKNLDRDLTTVPLHSLTGDGDEEMEEHEQEITFSSLLDGNGDSFSLVQQDESLFETPLMETVGDFIRNVRKRRKKQRPRTPTFNGFVGFEI